MCGGHEAGGAGIEQGLKNADISWDCHQMGLKNNLYFNFQAWLDVHPTRQYRSLWVRAKEGLQTDLQGKGVLGKVI